MDGAIFLGRAPWAPSPQLHRIKLWHRISSELDCTLDIIYTRCGQTTHKACDIEWTGARFSLRAFNLAPPYIMAALPFSFIAMFDVLYGVCSCCRYLFRFHRSSLWQFLLVFDYANGFSMGMIQIRRRSWNEARLNFSKLKLELHIMETVHEQSTHRHQTMRIIIASSN